MTVDTAAWAANFQCPNCGECNEAMVTTMKSCLCCNSYLIRGGGNVNAERRPIRDHADFCRVQVKRRRPK